MIAGLVAIMPWSGYVGLCACPVVCAYLGWLAVAAVLFGVATGTICNFTMQLKFLLQYGDCLDMPGLCCALGSGGADLCVQLLDLCIARDWGCRRECASCCCALGWAGC